MAIAGPNGGDATKAITGALEDHGRELTREAMFVWHEETIDRVVEAAENRAGIDSEGRVGREENDLSDLLDEITVPTWNEGEQAWEFHILHAAAVFHEFGAQPHEIEAKKAQALAFEWPDAPDEIVEQFEDSYPTVFLNKVEHPGTPAIGMVRYGRDRAVDRLEDAGISAEAFGGGER